MGGVEARKEQVYSNVSLPMEARTQMGRPGSNGPAAGTLHVFDIKKREDKVVVQGINGFVLDKDGGKMLYFAGNTVGIVEPAPGKHTGDGRLNIGEIAGVHRSQGRVEGNSARSLAHRARLLLGIPEMGGLNWAAVWQTLTRPCCRGCLGLE